MKTDNEKWRIEFNKLEVSGTEYGGEVEDFLAQQIQIAREEERERIIKMLEITDIQMSVNGDVSQDEIAMAKFLYKAHINHIKKKLQKDVSITSINTDSAKS